MNGKETGLRVTYGSTVHGKEEIDAVLEVLKTSTLMGKHVKLMETQVAALFNKKYGVMVNSGSSANYLAVEILKIPKGSEVITPILTFATTVAPIVKSGLIPAFVDVVEGTYNIDINKIEEMISSRTKAMMIPNLLGNFSDWKVLQQIAEKYKLILIEDSADCLGSTLYDKSTGCFSHISTTSFYGSHIINCAGNGGMLCMNDREYFEHSRLLRSWGRRSSLIDDSESFENRFNVTLGDVDYDAKFIFDKIGYNLEPSEIGAAFGLVQLNKLSVHIEKRIENFNELYDFFSDFKEFFILPEKNINIKTGWLAFPLCLKPNINFKRKDIQIYLEKRNIQTRTILTGNILKQPGFCGIKRIESLNGYQVTDDVMANGFLIGCHHGLDSVHIEYMKECFFEFIKKQKLV